MKDKDALLTAVAVLTGLIIIVSVGKIMIQQTMNRYMECLFYDRCATNSNTK
jgi:hypothetical protein